MSQAIVTTEAGTLATVDNNGSALTPINYLVSNLGSAENPNDVFGVPRLGSRLDMFGVVYTCDKVAPAEWIKDVDSRGGGVARVTGYFSTDGRWEVLNRQKLTDDTRNFDIGYKKVPITYPTFRREKWYHANPANPGGPDVVETTWKREDIIRQTTWEVLSINVTVECETDAEILNVIDAAQAQNGRLHIFPAYPNKKWVMLPCGIKRNGKKIGLNYSWESDPGSGLISIPGVTGTPAANDFVIPELRRLPFQLFWISPPLASDTDKKPVIYVADLFPTNDTVYYQPLGWQNLPGRPI